MRPLPFIKKYILTAGSSLYLLTVGIFSARHRAFMHSICVYFGLAKPPPTGPVKPVPLIPRVTLRELAPEDEPLLILEPDVVSGNISDLELIAINKLVKQHKPAVCFEIGTFDGRTTLNLAANAGPDTRIYTLDLPRGEVNATGLPLDHGDRKFVNKDASGTRFIGTPYERQITQLYGDSATFDFSPYHNSVDLVFVDGSHAYEYVRNDTQIALQLLRDGKGIILWHDYDSIHWKGLTRAMNELYQEDDRLRAIRHISDTMLVVYINR